MIIIIYLYFYKKSIGIPSLEMIDDIASISQCGVKSIKANTFINSNIEMMKLTMNSKKCKKIHMGKSNCMCPDLKVHGEIIEESDKES